MQTRREMKRNWAGLGSGRVGWQGERTEEGGGEENNGAKMGGGPLPCSRISHLPSCTTYCLLSLVASSVFQGNSANLVKVIPEASIRFWANERARDLIVADKSLPTSAERVAAGAIAGFASCICTYPLELIKTRIAVGGAMQYNSVLRESISSTAPLVKLSRSVLLGSARNLWSIKSALHSRLFIKLLLAASISTISSRVTSGVSASFRTRNALLPHIAASTLDASLVLFAKTLHMLQLTYEASPLASPWHD